MLLEQKLSVAKIQTNEMACVVSSLFYSRLAAIRPLLVLVQKSERSIFGKGAKGHSGWHDVNMLRTSGWASYLRQK